jgi:SepF-like predicted cell division protein (DUF552 family)
MVEDGENQHRLDAFANTPPPRSIDMPSAQSKPKTDTGEVLYHDLGQLYPDAPVPKYVEGLVLHRAVLHDLTGVSDLLDWLSNGEAAIVEMERLMTRQVELTTALERLNRFIENDLEGQIIRLTDTRLMLLPPGCRGVRGVETEAFAAEAEDLGRGGIR